MSYSALRKKQTELIRKAADGSVFVADMTADPLEDLTVLDPGPPEVIALVDFTASPYSMEDVGWLTGDGATFARDVAQSTITSWGSVSPTRTDVTSDTSTLTIVPQETKLRTIGLGTGADLAGIVAKAGTGEVSIPKPVRATSRAYRVLSLAVDQGDYGEIYIGRYLPRGKVSSYGEQVFGAGDEAIGWGVTFTGEEDSEVGYSERWLFGGPGWFPLLEAMGIPIEED